MTRAIGKNGTSPKCYTIAEFCAVHRIGIGTYYKLREQGLGPTEVRLLNKVVIITKEAAARWRAARDAEASKT